MICKENNRFLINRLFMYKVILMLYKCNSNRQAHRSKYLMVHSLNPKSISYTSCSRAAACSSLANLILTLACCCLACAHTYELTLILRAKSETDFTSKSENQMNKVTNLTYLENFYNKHELIIYKDWCERTTKSRFYK